MAKVVTYIMLISGVFAILAVLAIGNSATSTLLQALFFNNPENLTGSQIFISLFQQGTGIIAALGFALGTAIAIGAIRSQNWAFVIIAPFVSLVAGWLIGDIGRLMVMFNANMLGAEFAFLVVPIKIFLFILLSGLFVSLVSYWVGAD